MVPIGSLVAITHATPEPTNLLAPNDFSRFAVATGLSLISGGFLTYDNLYSRRLAANRLRLPAPWWILDIYGLMFDMGGGRVVDVWSNGDAGAGVDYGVGMATSAMALDYVGGGVSITPEPSALACSKSGWQGFVPGAEALPLRNSEAQSRFVS